MQIKIYKQLLKIGHAWGASLKGPKPKIILSAEEKPTRTLPIFTILFIRTASHIFNVFRLQMITGKGV